MHDGLSHEHSVEGVAMQKRQTRVVQRRLFIDWQRNNAVRVALRRHVEIGRLAERDPLRRVLRADFPSRRRAQEEFVVGRLNELDRPSGEMLVLVDHPQERTGVEEEFHVRRFLRRDDP
jgi:hypothetical protein